MAFGVRGITYWVLLFCAAVILLFAGSAKADVIDFTGSPFDTWNPGPNMVTTGYSTNGHIGYRIDIYQDGGYGDFGYHSETRDGQTAEGLGIYGGSAANEIGIDESMQIDLRDSADMVSAVDLTSFTINALHYYTDASGTPNFWESFEYSIDYGVTWTTVTQTTASGQNGDVYAPFTPGELTVNFAPGTTTSMLLLKTTDAGSGFVLSGINALSPTEPTPPAVPEPGSMILFGSAAGLMGWYRRRKSAKKLSS